MAQPSIIYKIRDSENCHRNILLHLLKSVHWQWNLGICGYFPFPISNRRKRNLQMTLGTPKHRRSIRSSVVTADTAAPAWWAAHWWIQLEREPSQGSFCTIPTFWEKSKYTRAGDNRTSPRVTQMAQNHWDPSPTDCHRHKSLLCTRKIQKLQLQMSIRKRMPCY